MLMKGYFSVQNPVYTKKAMHHVYNIRTYGVCIAKMWAAYLNIIFDMCKLWIMFHLHNDPLSTK